MERFKVGVDLGHSEVRLHDGNEMLAFPALLGGPIPLVQRGKPNLENNLSLRLEGKGYSLGKLALNQPFLFPLGLGDFADDLDLVLLLGILALYAKSKGTTQASFSLGLGLPVSLSRHPATLEAIAKWQTVHRFEFCGEPLELTIDRIDPIAQPMGTIYQALLEGQLDDPSGTPEELDRLVGVIDAGHAATSWLVASLPDELPQYSGCLTSVSGNRLLDTIAQDLLLQGIPQINTLAAIQASETGIYRNGNKESKEISLPAIEETLDLMALQLALTVKQRWQDLPLDHILITGGLGERLFERLKNHPFFSKATLADNPRQSNVAGFGELTLALDEKEETTIPRLPVEEPAFELEEIPVATVESSVLEEAPSLPLDA